jgi:ATP/maltotriose-dependent transcriptional regulator MalT
VARIHAARGNHEEPRTYLEQFREVADNVQDQVVVLVGEAIVSRADGNHSAALAAVDRVLELDEYLYALVRGEVLAEGVEAALGLGELARAESLLSSIDEMAPARRSQYLDAHAALGRARLLAARGDEGVDSGYRQAAGRFRELGIPFWLAVTLLEHAEHAVDGDGPAFAAEARETFEALGATPWIARADALLAQPAEVA